MNKEQLYELALSDIHKYSLLNEIFAIRDERFPKEQVDYTLCVNGFIGIDVLNDYVNLIKRLDAIKFYIEQSDIKDMLWGKEILKIIGGNDDSKS